MTAPALTQLSFALALPLALTGCGPDADPYDFGALGAFGTVSDAPVNSAALPLSPCVPVGSGCVIPEETERRYRDGERPADVVVVDGEHVATVGYSPEYKDEVLRIHDDIRGLHIDQTENGAVVLFSPNDPDAVIRIEGDIRIDGNQAVIYADDPDVALIDGDIWVDGNGARLRGLHVLSDITFKKNNAGLIHSVIEDDVFIEGNNVVLADVTILGDLIVLGENVVLTDVEVGGGIDLRGQNATCSEVFIIEDEDGDGELDDHEPTAELTCGDDA